MIMVTGGAGFIGSNLHAALKRRGIETVIVDSLGVHGKWRNLGRHPPDRLLQPSGLEAFLATDPPIDMLFHLGAISTTTASDADLVWETNVVLSRRLWDWCSARGVRFVYASSAATYGNGEAGFSDAPETLEKLRPTNLYGWSKHVFDLQVTAMLAAGRPRPPQWAGLKFFNVYGPNEYHKGEMISVVKVKHDEVAAGLAPRLFRSNRPDVVDGEQRRDFIWVGDVVEVMLWLLDRPDVSGLFNLGSGQARSYRALADAVSRAHGVTPAVDFIDMPEALRAHYQSFTEADMGRLRAAGFDRPFVDLEAGVARYVRDHLSGPERYV